MRGKPKKKNKKKTKKANLLRYTLIQKIREPLSVHRLNNKNIHGRYLFVDFYWQFRNVIK